MLKASANLKFLVTGQKVFRAGSKTEYLVSGTNLTCMLKSSTQISRTSPFLKDRKRFYIFIVWGIVLWFKLILFNLFSCYRKEQEAREQNQKKEISDIKTQLGEIKNVQEAREQNQKKEISDIKTQLGEIKNLLSMLTSKKDYSSRTESNYWNWL